MDQNSVGLIENYGKLPALAYASFIETVLDFVNGSVLAGNYRKHRAVSQIETFFRKKNACPTFATF